MESFKSWMDKTGVSLASAADLFGKTIGTIRNWRSAGVPETQKEWVRKQMRSYEMEERANLPERLTLTPSSDQFDQWNRAALREGKIVREWAMDAHDEAAEEDGTPKLYNSINRTASGSVSLVREKDPENG